MVVSAPILSSKTSNLDNSLGQIERTLKNIDLNLYSRHASAIAELKNTISSLEVAHLKRTALAEGVFDFYPTIHPVVEKMIVIAQIQPNHYILEPSAGSGDLAKAAAKLGVTKIDCFETNSILQKALKIQGFHLLGDDFLASDPHPFYDRIIANPPFSRNGVALHTQHAFEFLKPGGRLVTLGHHYNLKPSKTDRQFFAWLKNRKARFQNLGQAFKNSDRKTSVPLQLIVINKSDD